MLYENDRYWKNRRTEDQRTDWRLKENWVEDYWESRFHSHRKFLLKKLKKISFDSLLEIGCSCGPNLTLIKKKFSHTIVCGIDINKAVIESGRTLNKDILFIEGDIQQKLPFQNHSFDIVLADAVLMYISPEKIRNCIQEYIRIAKKCIIIIDWFHYKSSEGILQDFHWTRHYPNLMKEYRWETKCIKIKKEIWNNEKWIRHGYFFFAFPQVFPISEIK